MFRCTFLILCLALGNDILCTADTTALATAEPVKTVPTAAPSTATNVATSVPTPGAPTATPTPASTTAAPTTTASTTAAPTTTASTTAAPTTTASTTAAPTTTASTTAAPTTTASTTTASTTTASTPASTTAASTTANSTTANSTTAAPTSVTTPATVPTTTPAPTLPTPTVGKYSIKPDANSTACLMADFGLRIGYKLGGKVEGINLDPNGTKFSGTCGVNSSSLLLTSDTITVLFHFTSEVKKFHLHAVNVTLKPSAGVVFQASNANLTLWAAAVGSSYMCNKEQTYNITDTLTLYTFELRVQPFGVNKGEFSTADECSMDDTSILIPIIVGAALAGLILIVVIAYVIGRRKTYVGYQTL